MEEIQRELNLWAKDFRRLGRILKFARFRLESALNEQDSEEARRWNDIAQNDFRKYKLEASRLELWKHVRDYEGLYIPLLKAQLSCNDYLRKLERLSDASQYGTGYAPA